jgi:Na+-transporting NADH:ubiquinone oxidoreductase subunit C
MSEAMARDSTRRALGVALVVAFVCGLLVSVVSVSLRPIQLANVEAERIEQLQLVLAALSTLGRGRTIDELEQHMVELASGRFADSIDGTRFNVERAAASPTLGVAIPSELDLAGLKRRALHAQIYLVRDESDRIELIILPVSGSGYQSTLHAWLVLDGDTQTVQALKFYRHGETPGVGSRIEEPEWEVKWHGLRAFDNAGVLRIGVRSSGANYDEYAAYQVDGISGATRTMQGVDGMLRFWLGEFGYAPLLQRIREEQL